LSENQISSQELSSTQDSATDSSVDKIEKNEEESKVMKDQDSKEKLEEGMEVAKEEKSSIEEPKKEEKKSEAESTDVEMKPAEPESVAVNESQQDGTTVPSTTVSPVSVVQGGQTTTSSTSAAVTESRPPIVNQNSNLLPNTVNNVQANALSTLAALATSSELITSPVTPSLQPKASTGNINGSTKQVVSPMNQDALVAKSRTRKVSTSGQSKKGQSPWYDVAMTTSTSIVVAHFYQPNENGEDDVNIESDGDFKGMKKAFLESGTAYKFRVAGINVCGRGQYSDVAAFKTCVPGFPGAPSSIKITKNNDGAQLSWEPPTNSAGTIMEYAVYLAVSSKTNQGKEQPAQLTFVRVYCGASSSCTVNSETLASAHIDFTTKPAIIFRIAARNEKGYGPATQVRWLQDLKDVPKDKLPVKRSASDMKLSESAKKVKTAV